MSITSTTLSGKTAGALPAGSQESEALRTFFKFVHTNQAAIRAGIKPLAYCLSLADAIGNSPLTVAALAILEQLVGDERDYAISSAYSILIGSETRKRLCAYFTPPRLARTAMEAATVFLQGKGRRTVLDPACGGGSFLVPIARRITDDLIEQGTPPEKAVALALQQVRGIELDPGLAAISRKLLANALQREYGVVRPSTAETVRIGDALNCDIPSGVDLVIGNPPYGRVDGRASPAALARAGRAYLGRHTNLYSLFLLRALDAVMPGGGLVFILPASFVAGPYFAGLRVEILERADVQRIDLHEQRENLFFNAVQDVCLLTLRRHLSKGGCERKSAYTLNIVDASGAVTTVGSAVAAPGGEPWTLPVPARQAFAGSHGILPSKRNQSICVLADYGYRCRVGKVVPTRERGRLRRRRNRVSLPLIWSSDIRPDGSFLFAFSRRPGNAPWYDPPTSPAAYAITRPAVAVQRTSNREQRRRLNAAAVSEEFLREHRARGFVAENHVIVLEATTATPRVGPPKLAALLNSDPVNERFATVAGSFSVSAKLLERLAFPDPGQLPDMRRRDFEALLHARFAALPLVLAPSEPTSHTKDRVDKGSEMVGGRTIDEQPSLKRHTVA
jgi:adenine-specific DNA-methyltransferase